MPLSVIVVTYRTGPVLWECLAALTGAPDVDEAIVVDNGNPPDQAARLAALAAAAPKLRILSGHGNVGFAAGANLGARAARGERLVFLNPDAVLSPGVAGRLTQALDGLPIPSVVGGDLRDPQGRPERGSRRDRVTMWRAFTSFSGLSRLGRVLPAFRDLHRHDDPLPVGAIDVGAVSGALLALRRADFDALGGFDEGYFLHVEDIDLCRRVEQASGRVMFVPGPHGTHMRSTSEASAASVARHKASGFARYFRKFAANPMERACAEALGVILALALPVWAFGSAPA